MFNVKLFQFKVSIFANAELAILIFEILGVGIASSAKIGPPTITGSF